ncbi:MAG TPA: hypothetical protein PKH65_01530 [Bacteroidia bacterium]|nr:hypothetical protein [Bacteroidia bacterium]HNT79336.1 hypothetical protein [Bacteroidia bacterium]
MSVLVIHQNALKQVGIALPQRRITLYFTGSAIAVWVFLVSIATVMGYFNKYDAMPPRMLLLMIVIVMIVLAILFSGRVSYLLRYVPPEHLIYVQSFRIVVEIILVSLYYAYVIPVQMTFEGMNYDILIGITAPLIGYFCFVKKSLPQWVAIIWNILGILLIINVVTIAALSSPFPFKYFMNEPANTLPVIWPYSLLPSVLVPIALMLHFLSIKQLVLKLNQSKSN